MRFAVPLITVLGVAGVLGGAAGPAVAQDAEPITDRDWSLDLFNGVALGSVRIVGMGGVQVALAEGSAGTLGNPAASAARKATSTGRYDWDWHLDALRAVYASDLDNNGLVDDGRASTNATAGLAAMYYQWGVAVVVSSQDESLPDTGGGDALDVDGTVGKLAAARTWGDETWTGGVAIRFVRLGITQRARLFSMSGANLEAGVLYRPFGRDLRLGLSGSLPVIGRQVEVAGCDPMDCEGHILPERVSVPGELSAGVAWRFGPTRWNQWVAGYFRDEPGVIVGADVRLIGPVSDGMGLEAFRRGQWQRSGRAVSFGASAGVEWEKIPGRLRLRGGMYWEPGRFVGVSGRPHITAGIEAGFLTFRMWWNTRYRLRLGLTGDFAPRFGNAGLSFGFWR